MSISHDHRDKSQNELISWAINHDILTERDVFVYKQKFQDVRGTKFLDTLINLVFESLPEKTMVLASKLAKCPTKKALVESPKEVHILVDIGFLIPSVTGLEMPTNIKKLISEEMKR